MRHLCAVLLEPAQQAGQQAQQAQQAQQQRYEFFGFHFDFVQLGSAASAAAALPKGPTAAQRRDNAVRDKQSAGGVGLPGCGDRSRGERPQAAL